MKKVIIMLLLCLFAVSLQAQKCLDINILSLMGHLQAPGGAATCFGACEKRKNDHGQTEVVNYGVSDVQIDELVKRTGQDFTNASVANVSVSSQMPGQGQINDAKALAAKMQSMTDEEKKAYVMQMAAQMQSNYSHPSNANTESPATAKLVMQTYDIVTRQLKLLDDEFAAKFREILIKEKAERDAVKRQGDNECPGVDKVGMPACACVNGLAAAYWGKIVAIEDSYSNQKAALLQSYLPRIKSLVGMVEDNISKLQFGSAVKTATYKKMLFSSQSGAFGSAFDITGSVIHNIRQTGADAYMHKFNSDNKVEDLGCAHGS